MKKLETALNELGLTQSFFDELKAELETEKLVAENGLLSATKDDVEDEYNHLEASTDDEVDESDENEVNMEVLSPSMRALYK